MKNAFTGEQHMVTKTNFEKELEKNQKQWELDRAELEPYGDKGQMRPKTRGKVYAIPPTNGTYCEDKVDQANIGGVDINAIMKRIDPTGKNFARAVSSEQLTAAGMQYGDFTDAQTLQEALDITIHAREQFGALDADTRNRFENDPVKFMSYIHDPNKLEEHYNLGYRVKPKVPEPETTLKDVVTAVTNAAKGSKRATKGGDSED